MWSQSHEVGGVASHMRGEVWSQSHEVGGVATVI